MKIIKNEKLITRNKTIGTWASGIGILLVAIPFYQYTVALFNNNYENINYTLLLVLTIIGVIATQISMRLGNKFGRSPRADEKIDAGLKGLHSEFNMYHFTSRVSHLLVGPAGVWVLVPFHQGGKVSYTKNRWRSSGGGFFAGYMRIFGQEGLGRPELEAESQVEVLKKFFKKNMGESTIPEVKAILLFTNDQVELESNESPILAMKLKQLKEFIRQGSKNRVLTNTQISEITNLLPKE